MADTNLNGPYNLTDETIDEKVTKTSSGVYVLGYVDTDGKFVVHYTGRSDDDVNDRLCDWVGSKYSKFKFGYFSSAKAAFEKESRIYHDFGESKELDNEVHPRRPDDTTWECPVCDIFD